MLTWTPVCLPGYKRIKQARASHKRSHRVDCKEVHFALPQRLNIQISINKIPKCRYTYLVIEVVMKVVAQKQVHQSSLHSTRNTSGKYKFHARVLKRFEYNIHLSLFIMSKSSSSQTSMEEAEVGRNDSMRVKVAW